MYRQVVAVAAFCTLACPAAPINADETAPDTILVVCYPIADLPVWSSGGAADEHFGFDPTVLITLIRNTISPEDSQTDQSSWGPNGWSSGDSSVTKHPKTYSLIIRTTRENHRKVADLLSELRLPHEEQEDKQPGAQSSSLQGIGTDALHAIFHAERERIDGVQKAVEVIDAQIQQVESADLAEAWPTSLLESLRRCREEPATGEDPECGSGRPLQSSVSEPEAERLFVGLGTLSNLLSAPSDPIPWRELMEPEPAQLQNYSFGGIRFTR